LKGRPRGRPTSVVLVRGGSIFFEEEDAGVATVAREEMDHCPALGR